MTRGAAGGGGGEGGGGGPLVNGRRCVVRSPPRGPAVWPTSLAGCLLCGPGSAICAPLSPSMPLRAAGGQQAQICRRPPHGTAAACGRGSGNWPTAHRYSHALPGTTCFLRCHLIATCFFTFALVATWPPFYHLIRHLSVTVSRMLISSSGAASAPSVSFRCI